MHLDPTGLIPESQVGSGKRGLERGITDVILTARQLQEKCQEQNVALYMIFADVAKAFGTVSREGLWKIMAKFVCPPRFIAMVTIFMMTCRHIMFRMMEKNSGPFSVTNGVKQGCIMAQTLVSMMFSVMFTDAFQVCDAGFPNEYRFVGKLFNLRRLQAKSKVQTDVIDKLLYADDLVENAKQRENWKGWWIAFHKYVTTLISQSAQKRLR